MIMMKKCTLEDVRNLQTISTETFRETFEEQNSPEHLNAYLERAYKLDQLTQEIANPTSQFYFVYVDQELAGYLKVNTDEAQSETMDGDSLKSSGFM